MQIHPQFPSNYYQKDSKLSLNYNKLKKMCMSEEIVHI